MSRERYSAGYAPSGNKTQKSKLFAVLLLLGTAALVVASVCTPNHSAMLRAEMQDGLSVALDWLSTPVRGVRALIGEKQALLAAASENKKLQIENEGLRQWQSVAQALKAENDSLRSLAGYSPVEQVRYVTVRVIGQSPSNISASLMINAGAADGIHELQPVIDAYGLVGRIMQVADHSSHVLLLSDARSRIPVISAETRVHGILAGSGDALLRLTFPGQNQDKIALSESVVTTEEGALIPGGIAVGTVFKRDAQGVFIAPPRPLAQSEYLRVIVEK